MGLLSRGFSAARRAIGKGMMAATHDWGSGLKGDIGHQVFGAGDEMVRASDAVSYARDLASIIRQGLARGEIRTPQEALQQVKAQYGEQVADATLRLLRGDTFV